MGVLLLIALAIKHPCNACFVLSLSPSLLPTPPTNPYLSSHVFNSNRQDKDRQHISLPLQRFILQLQNIIHLWCSVYFSNMIFFWYSIQQIVKSEYAFVIKANVKNKIILMLIAIEQLGIKVVRTMNQSKDHICIHLLQQCKQEVKRATHLHSHVCPMECPWASVSGR